MLVDFTVANFRSIKEPVTLSAIATGRSTGSGKSGAASARYLTDEQIAPARPVEGHGVSLLPALAIFGANASGKSNVIRALSELLLLASGRRDSDRDALRGIVPFKLDAPTRKAPTEFQIRVAAGEAVFTYEIHVDASRVWKEQLDYALKPPRRSRLLYRRQWLPEREQYRWKNGEDFLGAHTQLQEALRPQQPYLGLLVKQLQVEVVEPLRDWLFSTGPCWCPEDEAALLRWTTYNASEHPEFLVSLNQLVRSSDTGIDRVGLQPRKRVVGPDGWEDLELIVTRSGNDGLVSWGMSEESAGTQRLVALSYALLLSLRHGGVCLIDELDASLHPHLARRIVRMFQDPATNPNGAQLVFTSHDATLHDGETLRRDQTWFTQKREDGSTELYSLSDFKVRRDLAIERAYLDGRFGAVPVLPPITQMLSEPEKAA